MNNEQGWVGWQDAQGVIFFFGFPDLPDFSVDERGSWWIRQGSKAQEDYDLIFS